MGWLRDFFGFGKKKPPEDKREVPPLIHTPSPSEVPDEPQPEGITPDPEMARREYGRRFRAQCILEAKYMHELYDTMIEWAEQGKACEDLLGIEGQRCQFDNRLLADLHMELEWFDRDYSRYMSEEAKISEGIKQVLSEADSRFDRDFNPVAFPFNKNLITRIEGRLTDLSTRMQAFIRQPEAEVWAEQNDYDHLRKLTNYEKCAEKELAEIKNFMQISTQASR